MNPLSIIVENVKSSLNIIVETRSKKEENLRSDTRNFWGR
jgi:hypothetical protein